MDRAAFRARLAAVGLDCQSFAALAGYSVETVRRFGESSPVPRQVRFSLALLEVLAEHHLPVPVEPNGQHSATADRLLSATLGTFRGNR